MMVIRQSRGRHNTSSPTEMRAHHGIGGGNFVSTRGSSGVGASFISVISLGLMTILSIGLQALPPFAWRLTPADSRPAPCLGTVLPYRKMVQEYGLYTGSLRKAQGRRGPTVPSLQADEKRSFR